MWIMRHNLAKVLSFTSATEEAALPAPFGFCRKALYANFNAAKYFWVRRISMMRRRERSKHGDKAK